MSQNSANPPPPPPKKKTNNNNKTTTNKLVSALPCARSWPHAVLNLEPSIGFAVEINHADERVYPSNAKKAKKKKTDKDKKKKKKNKKKAKA